MIVRHDAHALHLPATIEAVPGLFDRTVELIRDERPGAALTEVLDVLRRDPRSADALRCALLLCSGRTSRSGSEREPLTDAQLRDPLLLPIRTVCTRCRDSWWYSDHEIVARRSTIVALNPIGLQCQNCRYTVCRNCLTSSRSCPQTGCGGELGTPVLATGLPAAPLEYAVVLGERGRPQPADLPAILAAADPGADWAGVAIWAAEPPPGGVDDEFGLFLVARLESEGRVGAGALERTRLVTADPPGLGTVRVYLVEAPAGTRADTRGTSTGRRRRWWRRG